MCSSCSDERRTFPPSLKVGGLNEVVTVTADAEKQIDLRSTTIAHNVTAEEFDRMPKARSFQGIALTSPGVNQGEVEGGFQVNGASGAENSFTVDGVSTNSLLYGSSRQDTVFEYLQEVQVKTGGIAAEYGGALGGVISAVTKSGGNRFTRRRPLLLLGQRHLGEAGASGLQLSPIDDTTVSTSRMTSRRTTATRSAARIGGPIVKDRAVLLRLGLAAVRARAPTTTCSRTAPSPGRFRRSRPRRRRSAR